MNPAAHELVPTASADDLRAAAAPSDDRRTSRRNGTASIDDEDYDSDDTGDSDSPSALIVRRKGWMSGGRSAAARTAHKFAVSGIGNCADKRRRLVASGWTLLHCMSLQYGPLASDGNFPGAWPAVLRGSTRHIMPWTGVQDGR